MSRMKGAACETSAEQQLAYSNRGDIGYRGVPPAVVVGKLGAGTLNLESDYQFAASLTSRPMRFTITSPYMMAKLVHDDWYHDFGQLLTAIAGILEEQVARISAPVIQIDEPHLPGSAHDAIVAADAINKVLTGAQGDTSVHLCFGNFVGQRVQTGDYGHLVEFFNRLNCSVLVLETTRRPLDELQLLREVKPEMTFGLGVIDVKDLQIEQPQTVARRIEKLAEMLGPERIRFANPDCGLSHLPREVADGKLAALTAGRDIYMNSKPQHHVRHQHAASPHFVSVTRQT
jgi:5-methyltetrahydropteroyltriglutamate--homocysteine methyltransferase